MVKIKLVHLIVLGGIFRLIFALVSDHIYYPDELYQSLEPAHRLVYGYGIIPWDYLYQIRSYLLPGMLAIPLYILKLVGITSPLSYIPLMKIFLVLLSLTLIPGVYALTQLTAKSKKAALASSFLAAIWYELIYFSSRPFAETVSVYVIALSVWLIYKKRLHLITGILLGLSLVLRPQYLVLSLPLLIYIFRKQPKNFLPVILGWGSAILFAGLLDLATYGQFLVHLYNYFYYNLSLGVSRVLVTLPVEWYIKSLLIASGGLWIFTSRHRYLWLVLAGLIATHSLIPHKEYRFIFAAVPIFLTLVGLRHQKAVVLIAAGLISLLGLFHQLPWQKDIYPYAPLFQDPSLQLYKQLSRDTSLCGLYDTSRPWYYAGGYYYLHQNVPLYFPPEVVEPHHYNFRITNTATKAQENCLPDPNYTYYKKIDEIQNLLPKKDSAV